jgi:hypothetical protein
VYVDDVVLLILRLLVVLLLIYFTTYSTNKQTNKQIYNKNNHVKQRNGNGITCS